MNNPERRIDSINPEIEFDGAFKRFMATDDKDYRNKVLKPFRDYKAKKAKKTANKHVVKRSQLCREKIIVR